MKKFFMIPLLLAFVFLLSGCGQKETLVTPPLNQAGNANNSVQSPGQATALEKTEPKTTNDLPTAIDETDKDLKMIDNDLKDVDNLDMNEEETDL